MSKNKSVDVVIRNGRIHMQTTTVTGTAENIAKIERCVNDGDVFDVAGTKIKVAHTEQATSFMKKFGI